MNTTVSRRDKMISFRLSADEYEAFKLACSRVGTRSLSELARVGLQQVFMNHEDGGINDRLSRLRERIEVLTMELERITEEVRQRDAAALGHAYNHRELS